MCSACRANASNRWYVCTPGMANTVSTPCRSSASTMASPPVILAVIAPAREILAPHLARDLDDQLQLAPLIRCRERVSVVRAGEAALRAQAQIVELHVSGGCLDPTLERILGLHLCGLARHQLQHNLLALGYEAQRLEAARAFAVVLEEVAVDVEPAEHHFRNRFVPAGGHPRTLEVPAAGMDRDRQPGR